MKTKEQRLNNVIGQIEGIKKLLQKETDCIKVLTQIKAAKSALNSVMDSIVEDQFTKCMSSLNEKDKILFSKIKTYVKAD